jgi:hypothetical protein
VSGDERWADANLLAHAGDQPPPELTAAQQRQLADLVRYGAPVNDLPDLATYTAT